MGKTFYAQDRLPEPTMTVGALIEQLHAFDPAAPVVFRSPQHGQFGPGTEYTIERTRKVTLIAYEEHVPACTYEDDETGETITNAAHIVMRPAWSGVVIT
jgi:hypothetical protein